MNKIPELVNRYQILKNLTLFPENKFQNTQSVYLYVLFTH